MVGFVLGMLSALLVGGTLEGFRLWWVRHKRPELTLDYACAYARLTVRNAKGRDTASGVSVRIDRADGKSENDASEKLAFLATRPLAWADADRGDPNVKPGVNAVPGCPPPDRSCASKRQCEGARFVDVRPQPGNRLNYLGAGKFTFELVVSADNADARRYRVNVIHDGGDWDGDHEHARERVRLENLHRA